MGVWGTAVTYGSKAMDWMGTALDYGTKAASIYGAVQSFRSPDMPTPYAPAMPAMDPNAVTAMAEQAKKEGDAEEKRRKALYADKSGTVANIGGLGGLTPVAGGVGRKPTLLGGA